VLSKRRLAGVEQSGALLLATPGRALFGQALVERAELLLGLRMTQLQVGAGHVGGQADARLVPLRSGRLGQRLTRLGLRTLGAEQVDLPAGRQRAAALRAALEAALGRARACRLRLRLQLRPQQGARLIGLRLGGAAPCRDRRQAGRAGLRALDQHQELRVVEGLPPARQFGHTATVRQGGRCAAPGRRQRGGWSLGRRGAGAGRQQDGQQDGRQAGRPGCEPLRVRSRHGIQERRRSRSKATKAQPQSARRWQVCSSCGSSANRSG
jgi:hypothetical protein